MHEATRHGRGRIVRWLEPLVLLQGPLRVTICRNLDVQLSQKCWNDHNTERKDHQVLRVVSALKHDGPDDWVAHLYKQPIMAIDV